MRFLESMKQGGSRKNFQNNFPVNPDLKAIFRYCRERRTHDLDNHLKVWRPYLLEKCPLKTRYGHYQV